MFNISITGFDNGKLNIEVLNTMGMLIHSKSFESSNNLAESTLDLSNFNNGIYFIRVKGEDGFTIKRIVKK